MQTEETIQAGEEEARGAAGVSPPADASAAPDQTAGEEEEAPAEYDAAARQRIPCVFATADGRVPVTLVFDPRPERAESFDRSLREYARKLAAAQGDAAEDAAAAQAVLAATTWLFDRHVVDLEGVGEEGEEKPENWLDFFSPLEKRRAVEQAILFCYPVEDGKAAARPSWSSLRASVTRLRCFFDGFEIETAHTLRKADGKTINEFLALMAKSQDHSPVMSELAGLYDRLKVGSKGYKGGLVPLHHKAVVTVTHISRQQEVARKN